jgi:hypothetical protein
MQGPRLLGRLPEVELPLDSTWLQLSTRSNPVSLITTRIEFFF